MKHTVFFSMLLFLVLCGTAVRAQRTKQDMWSQIATELKQQLSLNDQQGAGLLKAGQLQLQRMDSLNLLHSLAPADRTASLKRIVQEFEDRVRQILSDEQWVAYQNIQAAGRDRLNKRRANKITVTPIN
ncbi:MAG TPA: hypothetical protein VGN00_21715 [Puia sp.]|jgi:hypothetical protein